MSKWSSEKKKLFVVMLFAAGLTLLSIVSYFFLDERVISWLAQNIGDFKKPPLIKAIILFGKVWLPVWLLLCWALLAGRRQEAMVALIAMLLLVVIVQPLKVVVRRPRPIEVLNANTQVDSKQSILRMRNLSFPSGDAATAFATAAAIAPAIGWFAGGFVFVLAVCVGALRVISLSHYPSDVCAGAAIGILSGCLVYYLVMSRPPLKAKLVELLSSRIALLGVIIIPLKFAFFGRKDYFFVFLEFYLPAVIILYLLSKIRKTKKPEIT